MKPLDFSLEEMRELLTALDRRDSPDAAYAGRDALLERPAVFQLAAEERCPSLRAQLESAEHFATGLPREIRRQRRAAVQPR